MKSNGADIIYIYSYIAYQLFYLYLFMEVNIIINMIDRNILFIKKTSEFIYISL